MFLAASTAQGRGQDKSCGVGRSSPPPSTLISAMIHFKGPYFRLYVMYSKACFTFIEGIHLGYHKCKNSIIHVHRFFNKMNYANMKIFSRAKRKKTF